MERGGCRHISVAAPRGSFKVFFLFRFVCTNEKLKKCTRPAKAIKFVQWKTCSVNKSKSVASGDAGDACDVCG